MIAAAYRKLARQYHPDRNPDDPRAEEQFRKVTSAYQVLLDPEQRKLYDEFGEDSLRSGFDPEQARIYQRWTRPRTGRRPVHAPEPFGFDLGDLFAVGFGREAAPAPFRGADVRAVVDLDLEQAIQGSEVTVEAPTAQSCRVCQGTGNDPGAVPSRCNDCGGTGLQPRSSGAIRITGACPRCQGRGLSRPPCPTCAGRGRSREHRTTTIRIPPGADNGSTVRIPERGEPGANGGRAGDLIVETHVRPHPRYRRNGLDLHIQLPVSLDEAYNGAEVEVPTFSGSVRLRIPAGSQSGTQLRLREKGVRRGNRQGDLYVELQIRLPEHRDEDLADQLRRSGSDYVFPLRDELRR